MSRASANRWLCIIACGGNGLLLIAYGDHVSAVIGVIAVAVGMIITWREFRDAS